MTNGLQKKMPILIVAMVLLAFQGGMLCTTSPKSEELSKIGLATMLARFRYLCDNGQYIQGLQIGFDAVHDEKLFNNSLYHKQESLLFEVAVAHLDYIDKILNPAQAKQCAVKSAGLWKKYIDWYHQLNTEQRSMLPPSHIRINMAVAHMGNSLIRKGDIYGLFDEYSNIVAMDMLYIGTDAISVWKNGLYGCPDGKVNKPHTTMARKDSINNGCADYWSNYASTLRDWVDVAPLKPSARKTYLREVEQIESEINNK